LLCAFLSFLPSRVTVIEPVLSPPSNVLAVPAYLNAKSGTLWFLPGGILWGESRPVEYWACKDLMRGSEGVRVVSATGRTCSVYLTCKGSGGGGDEDEEGGAEEEGGDKEEDLGEETEFAMIEGREMEGISRWVKEHRGAFGRTPGSGPVGEEAPGKREKVVHAGPMTINQIGDNEDEDEDASFEGSSSDSGSGGESSGEEGTDGGDEGEREPFKEDEGDDGEGEEDGEGELDPAHHPLMRPGAMPRVSRAVLGMVVDLVEDDMMGSGEQDGGNDAMMLDTIVPLTTGVVHVASDEEDELKNQILTLGARVSFNIHGLCS
jgi:hypothetical protein